MTPHDEHASGDDDARRSLELLNARVASIPDALRDATRVTLPAFSSEHLSCVLVTGIGASEGPARLLVWHLTQARIAARFVPLMTFAIDPPSVPQRALLIVFSQNLSPNARVALRCARHFEATWLVTSTGYEPGASKREPMLERYRQHGVTPIVVPPASEDGMLLRLAGPAVASLMALRLAEHLDVHAVTQLSALRFEEAAWAYGAWRECWVFDDEPLALIAVGAPIESLFGPRWKVLEALLGEDPRVWDALQVAHGPLQAMHGRALTALALGVPRARALMERLQVALSGPSHRVLSVMATRDDALSVFEHMGAVDRCLLATLSARPRNLLDWPGRHADAPLYDVGEDD